MSKLVRNDQVHWVTGKGYRKRVLLREDDLDCAGTLVQVVRIEPQTEVAKHHHESCTEAFHILSGSGVFTIDGTVYEVTPGDTLTCTPGEVHDTKNPYDVPLDYVVFKTNVVDDDLYWDA